MRVLVTGASGFIGSAICSRLASGNNVIGVDKVSAASQKNFVSEQTDLTDFNSAIAICKKYSPDVVIHCAGIAHQKIGVVDSATYMRVNSEATENLAKAAAKSNPGVCFVFFSSVSVYGEHPQITQISQIKRTKANNDNTVDEDGECRPSSDYAVSKLDAERRLIALYDGGKLHNLVILRLAPVYDRYWSLNLDRRVFAPKKLAYLRFGSGSQKMSALARPNLIDFIEFLLQEHGQKDYQNLRILNVCDAEDYQFNKIIKVFTKSGTHPDRPVISVPLSPVWFITRIAGIFFPNKKKWIHSCYDKLAYDLVFDNGRMMGTGFAPVHSLETIFLSGK
ncbi:MAG: NAD-dependent epimerase/dehydratase family protein [Deltaproteobacteria bacterium]|nr:NAD-dependent epimerase/dehydratase family protein [Deltaproteobacteria bacterium]